MSAFVIGLLLASPAAGTLEALLARGPVVSVEADGAGAFAAAVAYVDVEAPLEKVWPVVADFGRYQEFVPRVVESDAAPADGALRVRWEIDSPGMNTKYTVQYTLDERAHAIDGRQVAGDLRGSRWRFELAEPAPGRTRIRYVSKARNFSRVLDALEDEQQTMTAGLNVAAAVTLLRALKKRAEGTSAAPGPTAGSSR
ncbi:MAG TPA: SRPBCC family protein [Myxococcales bacterium]|nr:SRPBCC family protein [Myxococcales bacterium]